MFLCALETFNDFLLELEVLLELKELEVPISNVHHMHISNNTTLRSLRYTELLYLI